MSNWELPDAGEARHETKEARMGHRTKNQPFHAGQPLCLHCTMPHIQNQAGEGNFYRTNGLARVATHEKALGTGSSIDTMMKWRHNQANRAAIDMSKSMTSHLLIGWADVGT